MSSPIPPWLALTIAAAVFGVMFSLGLMIGRAQLTAAVHRRGTIGLTLIAVLAVVPAIAVLAAKLLGLHGAVAAGILLMAISPGAPVALRRAIEAGGGAAFAPALHLAILALAVVTVPVSLAALSALYGKAFSISPLDVGRQVLFAQLLPIGLGAALRAWQPGTASRVEALLARILNPALLAVVALLLAVLWPELAAVGWTPFAAGAGLTLSALGFGAVLVWRDPGARRVAAVAAAMRNPGLALLIATANRLPSEVSAAALGYAVGGALVVTLFVLAPARGAQ
ncbi:MAG TPA: hypothetical protein VFV84_11100 [Burkholderiales bacterium]|nr:hypothetical protein [Burkholderiales bacterium]